MYDRNNNGGWMPGQKQGGAFGMLGGGQGMSVNSPMQMQQPMQPPGRINPIPYTGPQPQPGPMPQQGQPEAHNGIMPRFWQARNQGGMPDWAEQMPWQQNWFKRFGGWQP